MSNIKNEGYRILSIEGGGIRGIIPARILKEIEERSEKPISQLFDIMVGTSTGALIVMALSMKIPHVPEIPPNVPKYLANDLLNIYLTRGNDIFKKSLWHSIKTGYGLWGPKYDVLSYEKVLDDIFGHYNFNDAISELYIPSFTYNPYVFYKLRVFRGGHEEAEMIKLGLIQPRAEASVVRNFTMKQIALAATAAPTYFPPSNKCIDGGVWANDPEMIPFEYIHDEEAKKNSYIVSIGTGNDLSSIKFPSASNSGIIGWLKAGLIDIMMNSQNYYSSKHLERLYNICKLQPSISVSKYAMDDASEEHIQYLLSTAETYIKENSDKIDEMIKRLINESI